MHKTNGTCAIVCDCDKQILVYFGSGKTASNHVNGYPPRSHDFNPIETHFANSFNHAQIDMKRREKKVKRRRTMPTWLKIMSL